MTFRGEQRATFPRRLGLAAWAGAFAAALAGCRSSGGYADRGGGETGGTLTSRDPLLGGTRIPPQNLPVPGKDGYGSRERRDPLLGSPTGRDDGSERAGKADGGGSASRGAGKEPFRPGPGTTNAALAGALVPDDTELSIGERRTPGKTTGQPRGPVPLRPKDAANPPPGPGFDEVTDQLKRYGATWDPPVREGGEYVFRCDVPTDPDRPGLVRRYEGAGPTAAAAAKQVLDQVKSDRK